MENNFKDTLPKRCRRTLEEVYGPEIFDNPQEVALNGPGPFKLVSNFGRVSLQHLAQALHQFGYIDTPEKWLCG